MRTPFLVLPLLLVPCAALAAPAPYVDVALVLAADVSGSMSGALAIQRSGFVAAFRDPDIARTIASEPIGRIAVTYVEWAGVGEQWTVVPWTIIAGAEDAAAFADRLAAAPVNRGSQTSVSAGLLFAAHQLDTSGVDAMRRTIDVSGDGPNNAGPAMAEVRDALVNDGITINGLPLPDTSEHGPFDHNAREADIDVAAYYADCVVGGGGSFVMRIDGPATFAAAVRRKLVLEVAGLPARVFAASYVQPAAFLPECATLRPDP